MLVVDWRPNVGYSAPILGFPPLPVRIPTDWLVMHQVLVVEVLSLFEVERCPLFIVLRTYLASSPLLVFKPDFLLVSRILLAFFPQSHVLAETCISWCYNSLHFRSIVVQIDVTDGPVEFTLVNLGLFTEQLFPARP